MRTQTNEDAVRAILYLLVALAVGTLLIAIILSQGEKTGLLTVLARLG